MLYLTPLLPPNRFNVDNLAPPNEQDMAELALGIVPLIGVAIKSYKELLSVISTINHSSSVVNQFYRRLTIQYRIFNNECVLNLELLESLDDENIQDMIGDSGHANWKDATLESDMRKALGGSYVACAELVEDVHNSTKTLEKKLDSLRAIKSERERVSFFFKVPLLYTKRNHAG